MANIRTNKTLIYPKQLCSIIKLHSTMKLRIVILISASLATVELLRPLPSAFGLSIEPQTNLKEARPLVRDVGSIKEAWLVCCWDWVALLSAGEAKGEVIRACLSSIVSLLSFSKRKLVERNSLRKSQLQLGSFVNPSLYCVSRESKAEQCAAWCSVFCPNCTAVSLNNLAS